MLIIVVSRFHSKTIMAKKTIIIPIVIIVLVGLAVLAVRFFSGEDNWICQNGEWIKHGNPKAEKPSTGCGEEELIPQPIEEEDNISVFLPKDNAVVSSPIDLEGKAKVFENVVNIRLKDKSGKVLFKGTTEAQSSEPGRFGLFEKEIPFKTTQEGGTLEVFETSAKDGTEVSKIAIPVKFGKDEKEESNQEFNGN